MTVTRRISKVIKDWIEYNIVWWGSEAVDTQLDPDSENPVQNKVIYNAVQGKLDAPATAWQTWQFVRKAADGNEWVSWDLASLWESLDDYSAMRWPCAEWFHVPLSTEMTNLINTGITLWAWTMSSWFNTYLKFPLAWGREWWDWVAKYLGDYWYYWSSDASTWRDVNQLYINSSWLIQQSYPNRFRWRSIRPFKDAPVVPDNSWTTLYQWTWSAWIYHNATLWLISISSDWENWITIADKNLWATTVWNIWDTLSEANCGKHYQRWNNYWFPLTWSVTTSSTAVDTSWYWPWNYYSSSTFITNTSWDWSSQQNDNLRWWETWVVQWWAELTVWNQSITLASENSDWFMSASDKKKLDSIKAGWLIVWMVDVLVVWGWWAWWTWSTNYVWSAGWWWGGWWVLYCQWKMIFQWNYNIVVWSGWTAYGSCSCNWWYSCFSDICAAWWWAWWSGLVNWCSWWSWWWAWGCYGDTSRSAWCWTSWQWNNWWKSCYCWTCSFWWGWWWGAGCNASGDWWWKWGDWTPISITWTDTYYWAWWGWWSSKSWWIVWAWWNWGWWRWGYCKENWISWTWYWSWGWGGGGLCRWWWGSKWIVVIRYKKDWSYWIVNATGWTKYECWDYCIHCFTCDWAFCPFA